LNITTTNTRELDKRRGARTNSTKTLPTLAPFVMCFNCRMVEKTGRNEQNQLEKRIQKINCINLSGKSMLIIQIEKEVYFIDIVKLKKLSMLSNGYCFYERNKKLKENHQLKKGIHYIQYRCTLKGGGKTKWYKKFDVAKFSKTINVVLKEIEKIRNALDIQDKFEVIWMNE
jgi:hypothetical protein